jgi:hypothetical protein
MVQSVQYIGIKLISVLLIAWKMYDIKIVNVNCLKLSRSHGYIKNNWRIFTLPGF